jgi:hypothetical protein
MGAAFRNVHFSETPDQTGGSIVQIYFPREPFATRIIEASVAPLVMATPELAMEKKKWALKS